MFYFRARHVPAELWPYFTVEGVVMDAPTRYGQEFTFLLRVKGA